ncbi:TonB-dependent siderophore receptor [Methylophaga muralis]|uniref:Ferripyoverdine receptor n=1 Tax=Methylophaga muralis TaxID=291169 RepID=A0A1E3GVZ4_9GAMM|nr:TonB-dependent receptor [Methylophaga muralis]ODN68217.1 Ferripyoverdine receptor precursor [Methylophaga muralis]
MQTTLSIPKRTPIVRAIQRITGSSRHLLLCSALLMPVTAYSTNTYAETVTQSYAIQAGELGSVLNLFASQAGVNIYFDAALTRGLQSSGLTGEHSIDSALQQLLQGTHLQVVKTSGDSYQLQVSSTGTSSEVDSVTLSPVQVSATGIGNTTEGTNSYTSGSMNTATRLGLSIRETPQSVSVITRQMIDDMQLESLTDVVNTVTGVTSSNLDSSRNSFSARGFGIDNYQIDGVPTTWEAGWAAGESQMDTVIYDRIEVVRGASGLISGEGNPSAAINLVRKKADSKEFTGYASISAGSWDRYQGTVDISTPLNESGTVRGRLVGSYLDERSFIDVLENEKSVFYGTLAADLTDNTLMNVGISQQQNKPTGSTWGGLPIWFSDGGRTDWSRSKTNAADWTEWSSTHTNYFANVEHVFDSGLKLYAGYSKNINDADLRLIFLSGYPDRTTGLGMTTSGPTWYDVEREQDNIDIYGSLPFDFAGQSHELTVGFLHSKQDLITERRPRLNPAPVGSFYDWDGSYPEPEWGEKTTYTTQKTKQVGGYAVARLTLADPLKLILGSRLTNWEIEGMKWNGDRYNFDHHQVVTPYAGLIYEINDIYSTYVSYTDIFNPQDAQDRNGNYLDPLEGENYEAGIKAEYLQGRVNATFSVFRIEQDNLAQADTGFLVPGTTSQASVAAEGTTSKGFEVEVSGAITENWNLLVGWSQFQTEDADGTAVNTNYPRRTATLFTTYRMNQLTLGGGVNWESSNYTMATNPLGQAEKLKQDSYALVRLMAKYQMTPALSAQLNINNVFDEKYYTNIGFYSQLAYGAPRNANLTLKYDF